MKISIGQNLSREHYVNLWGPESTVNGFHKKKHEYWLVYFKILQFSDFFSCNCISMYLKTR